MTSKTNEWIISHAAELLELQFIMSQPKAADAETLCADLATLAGWLARSAVLVAEAEALYDFELGYETSAVMLSQNGAATSQVGKIAAGNCSDIKRVYLTAERLNAALVHAIDATRTLISYEKTLYYNQDGKNTGGK